MQSRKKLCQTRGQRGSKRQKQILVKYMEKNVNFAQERFEGECGAQMQQQKWDELTIVLNAMEGAKKSAEQWKQYWRDLKRNVKIKAIAEKRKLNASAINGVWAHRTQLDEQEKRIISLMSPNLFDTDDESQERVLDIPVINIHNNIQSATRLDNLKESDLNVTEQSTKLETPKTKIKINQEYDEDLNIPNNKVELTKLLTTPESDDEFTIFGKFIISELRSIIAASNQIVYRQAKRKIQQVLMDTWDQIDRTSQSSSLTSYLSDIGKWDGQIMSDGLIEDDSNEDA